MQDMPYRQRFYVARMARGSESVRKIDAVDDHGVVRFYDDPWQAHDDADQRGGRGSGFVVMAVFVGELNDPSLHE